MSGPRFAHTRRAVELLRGGMAVDDVAGELGMTRNAVWLLKDQWLRDDVPVMPLRKIDRHPIGQRDLMWTDSALCAQVDPELFFPEKGCSNTPAKNVCRQCPVTAECLDFALRGELDYGIYGGMSDMERRQLRRGGAA